MSDVQSALELGYQQFHDLHRTAEREFSGVAGFTNNYINPNTNYKNGVDFHLDWGASQFLTKQLLVGAVGYVYDQLTGDSGTGDHVGPSCRASSASARRSGTFSRLEINRFI
jgi:hypothetical protein